MESLFAVSFAASAARTLSVRTARNPSSGLRNNDTIETIALDANENVAIATSNHSRSGSGNNVGPVGAALNVIQQASNAAAAPRNTRGVGYTRIEDLLVCKAFISASCDSQVGTSQKGKDFIAKMHASYQVLLKDQEKLEAS